jgi:hypothetical protein
MSNNQHMPRGPDGGAILQLVTICRTHKSACRHSDEVARAITGDVRQ